MFKRTDSYSAFVWPDCSPQSIGRPRFSRIVHLVDAETFAHPSQDYFCGTLILSFILEAEVKQWLRNYGIVVWLDKDGTYTPYVDSLAERHAQQDCQEVTCICPHCQQEMPRRLLMQHKDNQCLNIVVECANFPQCQAKFLRHKL